ncbi:hypothetical protein OUZ56_014467 [Daphnia magna]|uniref:Mediator of RNA polymerase II transcription subunit 15 n=1 Tax=Daphnia magna TaxID=35525 RepID=A0ABR0AJU6_9CRUS|nr:hypothetical protein OUZ56_014467 [Daphnia magna]
MATDDWKSPGFRQNVAARIEEAIRQSGNPTTKTASEMETHFFQRANNKEDYLNYLARLLIHIKELSAKARAQGGTGVGVAGPQGNVQSNNQQQQVGNISQPQMMNHMNVRPQMMQNMGMDQQQMNQMAPNQQQMNQMAPNQQQQMNQMAPNQQQQINQQQHQQMNQQQMNQMVMNQQQQNQQQQMNQQQMNQMGVNQQQQQNQQQMNQFNPNNPNMNIGNPLMQQLGAPNQQQQQQQPQGTAVNNPSSALISQLNQNQQQQNMGPMGGGMPRPRFAGPPGVTATAKMTPQQQQQQQAQAQQQQQMLNQQMLMQQRKQQAEMIQNPSTPQQFAGPGVPSPAQQQQQPMQSMQQQQPMSSGMTSHMSAPSPAYVHSPGNVQLVSSPAAAGRMGGPQQQQQQQQQRSLSSLLPPPSPSMMNVPTPGGGGMLHTPQGAGMGGMAMTGQGGGMGASGAGTEEQMYLEKVRQLSRFIEPLTRLIGRFGDDDSEKLSKMKIMLDILSNPSKRMPMDTLLKCEAVLEKMDFKRSESGSVAPPSVASVPSLGVAVPTAKDNPPAATPLLSLLETIANQARSPYINHTLQRTFAPAVNSLIGCDIAAPPAPKRRHFDSADDDRADELMDTIEREVANLYPRFKVDMDQMHLMGSQELHLICRLEDKYLPSVPALRIVVPRDYPRMAPFCDSQQPDYDVSSFTRAVLQGLSDRLRHMPHRYTVSQILNCWEMALRHACKPTSNNANNRDVNSLTVALGV